MTEFSIIWEGLVSGALYGLLGLAYLLILRATRTFNFSVGAFAGFAAVAFSNWSELLPNLALAIIATGAVTVALAIATDVVVARPIERREIGGHLGVVLGLTAALFVIIQITRQLFSARTYIGVPLVAGKISILDTVVSAHSVLTLLLALGVTASIELWRAYGKRGRLLAAVGDHWEAAVVLGLPVGGIRYLAVGLAGAICALTGILIAGGGPVNFYSSFGLAMSGFLALVVGGTASNWGPLLGGCLIGFTEVFGARLVGASIREYLIFAVIVLVFRVRPQGLLARSVRE